MNEKNFEYLKDNIKYSGFGEIMFSELENQLRKALSEFSLAYKTEVNRKPVEATLHFKRSDTSDMYFFNKYDVRVSSERNGESVSQTFHLNKGQGVSLKEAYNLLNGRAVLKELTDREDRKYQAWIQLDFKVKDQNGNFEKKQYHQNYGYDLAEALSAFPIKEMKVAEDRERLTKSLQKGNVQIVTMETPAGDKKIYVEANPKFKSVDLYTDKMQRLGKEERQEFSVRVDPRISEGETRKSQDQKKAKEIISEDPGESKKKSRKKGLSI